MTDISKSFSFHPKCTIGKVKVNSNNLSQSFMADFKSSNISFRYGLKLNNKILNDFGFTSNNYIQFESILANYVFYILDFFQKYSPIQEYNCFKIS